MIKAEILFLKYEKTKSGSWFEKKNEEIVQIEKQSVLNKYPEKILDKCMDNPGQWIEYKIKNKE